MTDVFISVLASGENNPKLNTTQFYNTNFEPKVHDKMSLCVINGTRNNSPAVTKKLDVSQLTLIRAKPYNGEVHQSPRMQRGNVTGRSAGWLHGVLQQSTVAGGRSTEVSTDRSFAFFAPVLLHQHLHAYTAIN